MISAPGEPPGSRVSWTPMPNDLQPRRQHRRMGRLAGALAALECDEASAHLSAAAARRSGFYRSPPLRTGGRQATYIRLAAERNRLITSSDSGIEGALRDRARGHAFGRLHRHFEHLGVAAPDLQLADRLALAHRRPDRPGVDHLGDDLVADAARHHQLDRALGGDRDAALRAADRPWPRPRSGLRRTAAVTRNS